MKSVLLLAACLLFVSSNGQGPSSSLSLMAGTPYPAGVSVAPAGCGKRVGLGCVKSVVVDLNCAHGTYVDTCNMCKCAKRPIEKIPLYINAQRDMYSLQGPGSSLSLTAGRPHPLGVSVVPAGCGKRVGLGCVKSVVVDLNCAHGTYVDTCNMCKCAKGPIRETSHYIDAQRNMYSLQGPSSSLSLKAGRPYPALVSAGPVGCGQRIGLGCVKSIVVDLNCAHGTYVDACNMCKCAKVPSKETISSIIHKGIGIFLGGLGSSHSLMAARPFPHGVSAGPRPCSTKPGQGCVQSIVADMKCAHGTYVDMCNMCQCAKGPNEICGGASDEHGQCTTTLHCFKESVSHFVGKCGTHIDG